jgi:alkylation response protein AidB-like acyl-CoA dehydrogenase
MDDPIDTTLLRDSAARLINDGYGFDRRRAWLRDGPDPATWQQFARMGWLALPFAEPMGGLGGTAADVAVLMREFGRGLVLEAYLPTVVLAGGAIARLGSADQRATWLPPLLDGTARVAWADSEPGDRADLETTRTVARLDGPHWRVDGEKIAVLGGDDSACYVVTARRADADGAGRAAGPVLLLVPRDTTGLQVEPHVMIDGQRACRLVLRDVVLPADARLGGDADADADVGPAVQHLLDTARALSCAEACGVLSILLDDTLAHTRERRQFGRTLASNQVVAHRLVDMQTLLHECEALAARATDAVMREAVSDADVAHRQRIVSTACRHVAQALRLVGQEAVQLHGAIGMTDDLRVGHAFRRATVLARRHGDADWHTARLAALNRSAPGGPPAGRLGLTLTAAEQRFADEVRTFVAAERPPATARKVANEQALTQAEWRHWERALARRGWLTCAWPAEQGGPGWTPREQLIFDAICMEMDCPAVLPFGPRMVGPVLLRYGTPEQQARFLPGIRDGSVAWCQGYSEPGAGSDLAALATRAERRGDRYVVNGQKIWTSYAHWADWMFCLVRTGRGQRPQQGISFLLIDMRSPGIEVRPIITIDGGHTLNSVFFTDVEVPAEQRVGDEGGGWTCAKYLLGHERLDVASLAPCLRTMRRLVAVAFERDAAGRCRADDLLFAAQLVDVQTRLAALEARVLDVLQRLQDGVAVGAEVSQLKVRGTELYQRLTELIVDATGLDGLAGDRDYALGRSDAARVVAPVAATAAARYFSRRAMSILGGSNEIQHDILAKAALGL